MKLHLLENLIDRFISSGLKSDDTDWYFTHSIVDHFHKTWFALSSLGLKEQYDQSLRSDISQRWWKRDHYRPKEIMLKLIDADIELSAIAFKDLANESATLEGRLSRFNFYAEELLQMHRKNKTRDIETHHHQDAGILSLYLAGWYPEKYILYPGLDIFQSFCKSVGSPDIPVVDDLPRLNKVGAIIYKYLQKNIQFNDLIAQRSNANHKINFLPYQAAYDVIIFTSKANEPPG